MAEELTGSVEVRRIWQLLEKILSAGDLSVYRVMIDSKNDTQSYQVPLDVLLSFAGGGGSGDVSGPVGATNNAVVLFDTASGKLIKDSTVLLSSMEYVANKDASGGYVGKTGESINFWNAARTFESFLANTATASRTYSFPNKSITVAGLDDITVVGYFDASVGTGGNYTTLYDAIQAGKVSIKIISNVVETVTNTDYLTNRLSLINVSSASNYTITFASGSVLNNTSALVLYCKNITLIFNAANASKYILGAGNLTNILYLENSVITLSSICKMYCISSIFYTVTINLANAGCSLTFLNSTFNNFYLVGGGTSCGSEGYPIFSNCIINNFNLSGTFTASNPSSGANACAFKSAATVINNILDTSTNGYVFLASACSFYYGNILKLALNFAAVSSIILDAITITSMVSLNNAYTRSGFKFHKCTMAGAFMFSNGIYSDYTFDDCYISASATFYKCRIVNCHIVTAASLLGDSTIVHSSVFDNTIGVTSDYNKLSNNIVTGLLTLNSGSEYNVITENTLTGGLTNSSGNNTNYIIGNSGVVNVFPDNIKLPNLTTKTMIGTDSNGNLQGTALTTDKMWIGVGNVPTEVSTVATSLNIGDFTGAYSGLATETNWIDNNTNAVAGSTGDQHFGVGSIGCSYYAYYSQSGWNRFYVDNRITYATLITELETSGNWTSSTYNATIGDYEQIYTNESYEYRCIDGVYHIWYRNDFVSSSVTSTDITFLPKPQVEVGKVHGDYFTIEAKYDIVSIMVEAETTTAGNISIGSTGTQEVAQLVVTAACSVNGNAQVVLDGVTFNVALTTTQNTTVLVATVIRNATYTGWTTGGTSSTVTFTSTKYKTCTDATYSDNGTGATGTMTTTTQGVNPNSDLVASTSLPIVIGNKKQLLYVVDPNYPTTSNRNMYIGIDSLASVKLLIVTQKLFS